MRLDALASHASERFGGRSKRIGLGKRSARQQLRLRAIACAEIGQIASFACAESGRCSGERRRRLNLGQVYGKQPARTKEPLSLALRLCRLRVCVCANGVG